MTVPFMDAFVLLQGPLSEAHTAIAAALFDLANKGYVTIGLGDERYDEVILTRTKRPESELEPGDKEVLAAVFGEKTIAPGAVVALQSRVAVYELVRKENNQSHLGNLTERRMAQTVMIAAQRRLQNNGLIKHLRPMVFARRLRLAVIALWAVAIAVMLFSAGISWALAVACLGMIPYFFVSGLVIGPIGRQRLYLTPKGKLIARELRKIYRVSQGTRMSPKTFKVAVGQAGHSRVKPTWWVGPWPGKPKLDEAAILRAFNTIAEAVRQTVTTDWRLALSDSRYYMQDPHDDPQ